MKSEILIRVLGYGFYRKYFAAFAILMYFAFGILTEREHLMLAKMINDSSILLLIIMIIWATYIFSTVNYVSNSLQKDHNRFLLTFSFIPKAKQVAPLLGLQFVFSLPVTGYGLFLIFKNGSVVTAAILAGFLIAAHLIPVAYYFKFFEKPFTSFSWKLFPRLKFKKPFITWPVLYVWNENPIVFMLMKILACGIIFLTAAWDDPEIYDERWWLLGIFFASLPGLMLLKDVVRFLTDQKILLGQVPWSLLRFVISFSGTVLLLLLPEFFFILRHFNYDRDIVELIIDAAFLHSLNISILLLLLKYNPQEEKLLTMMFYLSIGMFLLILFSVPGYLLIVSFFLPLLWLLRKRRLYF